MNEEHVSGQGHSNQIPVREGIHAGDDGDGLDASVPTIVDRLNDDCWRVVLDHVPVKDIIRSERVCRRWQGIVHRYLQDNTMLKVQPKNRILTNIEFNKWLDAKTNAVEFVDKWGWCIVYTYCPGSRGVFERIARNCPNLKGISIELHNFETGDISEDIVECVERLQRIAFLDFACMDNLGDSLDMWDEAVQKAAYAYRETEVLSAFWRNFRPTSLKTLTFRGGFDFRYFLTTVECFPKLTELILQDITMLLDEMCQAQGQTLTNVRLIDIYTMSDEDLVTLISSCRNLKSLDLRLCDRLSNGFLKKVASAVQESLGTLRVHIGGYEGVKYTTMVKGSYPGLLLEIEPPPQNSYDYFECMRPREYIWGIEDERLHRDRSVKLIN